MPRCDTLWPWQAPNNRLIQRIQPINRHKRRKPLWAIRSPSHPTIPNRALVVVNPDEPGLPHLGLAGDTYTVLLSGKDTAGRYCLIDMHVPPGGGPGPHRHDFEESFIVLAGAIEVSFRGQTTTVRMGQTANIPANAPHEFNNVAGHPARLLCICSPAGQDAFFEAIGVSVASPTTPPPNADPVEQAALRAKAEELAPQYQTELL